MDLENISVKFVENLCKNAKIPFTPYWSIINGVELHICK